MRAYERTMMIAEKEFQIAMNEIAHAEAIIESKLELNMQRAELKVLQESGTELDLIYLYEAAGDDADKQKDEQGIISKIITAIKNFWTKAWNGLQRIFTGKDTEAYQKLMKKGGKFNINIPDPSEMMNQVENAVSGLTTKTVGIGASIAAAIASIIIFINKLKKKGNAEVEISVDKANNMVQKSNSLLDKLPLIGNLINKDPKKDEKNTVNGDDSGEKDATGLFGLLTTKLKEFATLISTPIKAGLAKLGINVDGNNNSNQAQPTADGNGGNPTPTTDQNGGGNAQPTPQPTQQTGGNTSAGDFGDGADGMNEHATQMKLYGLSAMLERMGV